MVSLEQVIASKFKELKKTLSVAESCTGGSICSRIVSNEGASTYFKGGVVCYSTESKTNILGLDAKTINDYSVVSKEVCELMAISVKISLTQIFLYLQQGMLAQKRANQM